MPLTYLSRKAILEYLEPNKRLTLAAHCPQTWKLHQQLPLVINHLKIRENSFTLNGFDHLFLTTLVLPDGRKAPRCPWDNGPFGGLEYDVDEFGEPEPVYLDPRPGDMKLRMFWDQPEERDFISFLPITDRDLYESPKPKVTFFIRYVCCKENFQKENQKPKLVKLPAGIKIRDALRHLLGKLFSKNTIIRHLEFDIFNGIARLPEDPRIEVHTLSFAKGTPEVYMALNFKRPLRNLNFRTNETLALGKSDGPLVVYTETKFNEVSMKLFDHFLANRTIHFSEANWFLNNYHFILANWIKKPRHIGARISCKRGNRGNVQYILDCFISDFQRVVKGVLIENKCQRFPYCGTISIDQGSKQLNIYGDRCPKELEEVDAKDKPYMIVFEVMKPGSAVAVLNE